MRTDELVETDAGLLRQFTLWTLVGSRDDKPFLVRYCNKCGRRETKDVPEFMRAAARALLATLDATPDRGGE